MSYIEQYFGKKPQDIVYQDIVEFFQIEREESDKIEFKSYHSQEKEKEKLNTLIQTVCAFLNSSGGLIIWGAPIGKTIEGKTEKIFTGQLSPVTKLYEKDSFINKATDSITPSPNLISFNRYEEDGNYIYLIEVNQSEYSPHQFKNIYYMRIDGQTRIAPHHFIEALFKKITYPKLQGYIVLDRLYNEGEYWVLDIKMMIFNMSKIHNEHHLYYRAIISHGVIFEGSLKQRTDDRYQMGGHELRCTIPDLVLYYNQPYRFSESLRINKEEIRSNNNEFILYYYFGGKKSPLLVSKYILKIDPNKHTPQEDLNTLFSIIDENRYFFELSDEMALTEKERLGKLIKR